MHRRGVGIGAIKNKNVVEARFKDKGSEMASEQLEEMTCQMEIFKNNLEEFASKHKEKIKKNSKFRFQFQEMCAAIGVDPLASSKGFWCKLLNVGDFYYELGVQLIETCLAVSHRTGGLMEIDDLKERLNKTRGKNQQEVSNQDILTCIKNLQILGEGIKAVELSSSSSSSSSSHLIQSVPGQLTLDHTNLLKLAQKSAHINQSEVEDKLKWTEARTQRALEFMLTEGLAWLDTQEKEPEYWFPGFFHEK